jgi:hypothetical protein
VEAVGGRRVAERERLDQTVCGRIGAQLRAIYADKVEREPIPNDQVELLLALRRNERERRRQPCDGERGSS